MNFYYAIKNDIAQEGLELFTSNYQLSNEHPDVLLVRSASLHEVNFNPQLKAIARAGVGVNNIPLQRCAQAGIVVFNTPGANANAVKELVIASMILASRDVLKAHAWIQQLDVAGTERAQAVEAKKSQFVGPEIAGKTLGVVGLGAIGVLIANAAAALGMEVYGVDPYISIHSAWGLSRMVKRAQTYDEIFSKSDYISLHVPLNDQTHHLINARTLKKMKTGVRILNFARAELVDDHAMKDALTRNQVARYVTDFPNEHTRDMPNVIEIPHLGASTPESEVNCAKMAVQTLMDYLEHGNIKHSVNYPDCDLGMAEAGHRISIHHQNIPNMVGQMTSLLGQLNVNISALQNASKGEWAYTLIDVERPVDEKVDEALRAIEGVVRVRRI